MNVITTNPIIEETYSEVGGKKKKTTSKKKGQAGTKLKNAYTKVRDAGGVTFLENLLGVGQGGTPDVPVEGAMPTNQTSTGNTAVDEPTKSKFPTWAKWVIGLAVVGGIGYGVYRMMKTPAKGVKKPSLKK